VGVLAVAALSMGRIAGHGPFDTIWAEDAENFLNDAWNYGPLHAILTPFNGYYHIAPRLMAEVASHVPVAWAPTVLSIEVALVTGLVALGAYVASGAHFSDTLTRLVVALPVAAVPVAENNAASTANDAAPLQFFALYGVFWMLLWVPNSRFGRVVAVTAVGLTAFSSLLAVVFVPLALVRLFVRRGLTDLLMAVLLVAGASMDVAALTLGLTSRPSFLKPRFDVAWAIDSYWRWALPHKIFGYQWLSYPYIPVQSSLYRLVALAWLLVLAAIAVAALRITRPVWGLALVAGAYSVGLVLFQIMSSGAIEERYAITPCLLLIVVFAALLRPSARWFGKLPLLAYATLLVVVMVVNYRDPFGDRALGPAWSAQLRPAIAQCKEDPALRAVTVYTSPPPNHWRARIPCKKLR
jgi:hypothetical protein